MNLASTPPPGRRNTRRLYSRIILFLALFQIFTGLVLHAEWILTGNQAWLQDYFNYQGAIYFIFLDVFKLCLCVFAWQQFKQKESLRSAWFVISLAMGFQLAGDILKHWLAVDTYMNPLHYVWQEWNAPFANTLHEWGSALAGPLFMAVLAVGLYEGLLHYKRIGMRGKLRPLDLILVSAAGIYGLYVIETVVRIALKNPSSIQTGWILTWPNDLLLAVLLLEAILLFRTSADMGQGYIARAWGAFAVAIFLTCMESLGQWLTAFGYFRYPENAVMWYLWFVWAAVFALAPAYQVDAITIAESRLTTAPISTPPRPTFHLLSRPPVTASGARLED